MSVSPFDKMTVREARIEFVWGVVNKQLAGVEKCKPEELKRRRRVAQKALSVSPELRAFVDVLTLLFKPERPSVRKRMENAKVPSRTREVIETFTKGSPAPLGVVETTAGGGTVIRLPTYAGRETRELKQARRALIERAAQARVKPPPEAS